jgi:hypothetical protein
MDTRWSGEAKYQALLAVAQAANSRRELSSVLNVVAGALERLVPVDLIGVVTHTPETVRARAIYFRSAPRGSGESQEGYVLGQWASLRFHSDHGCRSLRRNSRTRS